MQKALRPVVDAGHQAGFKMAVLKAVKTSTQFGKVDMTPMLAACQSGNLEQVRELVQQAEAASPEDLAALLNERDTNFAGSAALHWAAFSGNADLVQYLLEAKADPRATNTRDKSHPLHLAARYGKTEAVDVLLRRAPEMLNNTNDKGNSALIEAAAQGHDETAKLLLGLRAALEHRNTSHKTALLVATEMGELEAVRVLLAEGASAEAETPAPASPREARVGGQGAISAALSKGQLHVLLELLLWGWGRQGSQARPPLYVLSEAQVRVAVLKAWARPRASVSLSSHDTARLFTLMVLSCKADEPGHDEPASPVAVALRVSHACSEEAKKRKHDKEAAKLAEASATLELIACGFIHVAQRAVLEAEEPRQYNTWTTGAEAKRVDPQAACEIFVRESVREACDRGCKNFFAHHEVYAHILDMWSPKPKHHEAADDWVVTRATHICLNIVALPLLPLLPRRLEKPLEKDLREMVHKGEPPLGLVWLLPVGRFALWFFSVLGLAALVSLMPPVPSSLSWWEVGLALYLGGFIEGELAENTERAKVAEMASSGEAASAEKRDADQYFCCCLHVRYLNDVWNRIDLALIVVMAGVLGCRLLAIVSSGADGSAPPLYSVGFQALSALLAWLRLLQTLFVFPESGPLLLMTLQMFRDLKTFLMLALVIVLAFGCAFLVLFTAEDPQFRLTLGDVVEKLIEAALGGEPYHFIEEQEEDTVSRRSSFGTVTTTFMLVFGIVVVLLLLNLLIAR